MVLKSDSPCRFASIILLLRGPNLFFKYFSHLVKKLSIRFFKRSSNNRIIEENLYLLSFNLKYAPASHFSSLWVSNWHLLISRVMRCSTSYTCLNRTKLLYLRKNSLWGALYVHGNGGVMGVSMLIKVILVWILPIWMPYSYQKWHQNSNSINGQFCHKNCELPRGSVQMTRKCIL